MFNLVNLKRHKKCGFLVFLGMAWASLKPEAIPWAKFDPNLLKGVISDVYKVGLAVM